LPPAHRPDQGVVNEQCGGPDLVKSEFELGDDTEVAVAATQPPEQVLMVRLAYP
jgi:hypothetical protein